MSDLLKELINQSRKLEQETGAIEVFIVLSDTNKLPQRLVKSFLDRYISLDKYPSGPNYIINDISEGSYQSFVIAYSSLSILANYDKFSKTAIDACTNYKSTEGLKHFSYLMQWGQYLFKSHNHPSRTFFTNESGKPVTVKYLKPSFSEITTQVLKGHSRSNSVINEYTFRKKGEMWQVNYEDESALLKHARGLLYIQHALMKPNHSFSFTDLHALIMKHESSKIQEDLIKLNCYELPLENFDMLSRSDCERALKQLKAESDSPETGLEKKEEIDIAIEKIEQYLSGTRSESASLKRRNQSVRDCVKYAKEKFCSKNGLRKLGEHLKLVKMENSQLTYHLDENIEWNF